MIRVTAKPIWASLVAVSVALASVGTAGAQQAASIEVTSPFPSVLVDRTERVTLHVNVANRGEAGSSFDLLIAEAPEGWEANLRSSTFGIRSMYLGPGEDRRVDFRVQPPQDAEPGDYHFLLSARDGGAELSRLPLTVSIREQPVGGVRLVTQYPMLRGPSTSRFQFKLELTNDADEERNYTFNAAAPSGWNVIFKPAFEDRQITSISMTGGDRRTIDVEVEPPRRAPAGEYDIRVETTGAGQSAEADLRVTLTGTHELALTTPSGRLNAQATAGQASPASMLIGNSGTAELQNISVSASRPDGWDVRFEPDTIETLQPGESRQVDVTIQPSARAIAGDYMLNVSASTPQTSRNVDMRVTVETPTVWGLVGAGVIFLVLGGLYGIFRVYGRR